MTDIPTRLVDAILDYAALLAKSSGTVPAADVAWKLRTIIEGDPNQLSDAPVVAAADVKLRASVTIPTRLVEAAARALHEDGRLEVLGEPTWDGLEDADRDSYRKVMRVALAAVFAECEVREEWRESGEYQIQDGRAVLLPWAGQWRGRRPVPKTDVDNWHLARRLVITTPPEDS